MQIALMNIRICLLRGGLWSWTFTSAKQIKPTPHKSQGKKKNLTQVRLDLEPLTPVRLGRILGACSEASEHPANPRTMLRILGASCKFSEHAPNPRSILQILGACSESSEHAPNAPNRSQNGSYWCFYTTHMSFSLFDDVSESLLSDRTCPATEFTRSLAQFVAHLASNGSLSPCTFQKSSGEAVEPREYKSNSSNSLANFSPFSSSLGFCD